jgi:hypothetical protein
MTLKNSMTTQICAYYMVLATLEIKSTSCLNRNPRSVKRPVESALDFCGKFIDNKWQYKNVICRTNARITTHRYLGMLVEGAIKHKNN